MEKITYQELVDRYGSTRAFDLLLTVEKLAKIKYDINVLDEAIRFERALEALNVNNFAA
jgi:hypothetical protein